MRGQLLVICNTGTTGKSHLRWRADSISFKTLCGRAVVLGNKDDEQRQINTVECVRCRQIMASRR